MGTKVYPTEAIMKTFGLEEVAVNYHKHRSIAMYDLKAKNEAGEIQTAETAEIQKDASDMEDTTGVFQEK
jgi:phage FluMu gp28-like protein